MSQSPIVYLNAEYCTLESAKISPLDRGFLFAHAAYEVCAVFRGSLVDFSGHIGRLGRTLGAIDIPNPKTPDEWRAMHEELITRNELDEGMIYLQVTAGAYDARDFAGPEVLEPTVFAFSDARSLIGELARIGYAAALVDDTRWTRRDLKTTQLLSQALGYRTARDRGAFGAVMVEDGLVTETASANAWIVTEDGTLVTRALSSAILAGITRGRVMQLAQDAGLSFEERAFAPNEAFAAKEMFSTSATGLVSPITKLDEQAIGSGEPGPMTRRLQRLYYEAIGADVATRAPWCQF